MIVAGCSQVRLILEPWNEGGQKPAGFLKAKEKAIKCNGCSLNRAWSFLMVPGCGQDIVLVDLMSGLSCGAAKCCAPSLYRSSTGNSAAYVALTSLYILGKSINISQRLIANAATKQNTSKELYIYTPLLLCLLLLPLIYHYGCSERASDCRSGWDPMKRL